MINEHFLIILIVNKPFPLLDGGWPFLLGAGVGPSLLGLGLALPSLEVRVGPSFLLLGLPLQVGVGPSVLLSVENKIT